MDEVTLNVAVKETTLFTKGFLKITVSRCQDQSDKGPLDKASPPATLYRRSNVIIPNPNPNPILSTTVDINHGSRDVIPRMLKQGSILFEETIFPNSLSQGTLYIYTHLDALP